MASGRDRFFDEYNRQAELAGWPNRLDPSLSFEAQDLREALAVWRNAAGTRLLPLRTDLTPKLMKSFLAKVAVLDVVREDGRTRFRVRVTGSALDRNFGGMTGKFLDESLPEPFLTRWVATLNVALQAQGPARTSGKMEFRDQIYLNIETFYAPMGADPSAPDAILIVVHTEPNKMDAKAGLQSHVLDIARS
jgi:hypothetical protein